MGTLTALQYALALLDAIPRLVQAGADVTSLVTEHRTKIDQMVKEERDPTEDEWDTLNAKIEGLRNRLHEG